MFTYTMRARGRRGWRLGFALLLGILGEKVRDLLDGEGKKANESTRRVGGERDAKRKKARERERDGISERRKLRESCPKGAFFRRLEKGVRRGVRGIGGERQIERVAAGGKEGRR